VTVWERGWGLEVCTYIRHKNIKNILDNHVNLNVNGSMSDTEGDGRE